jgi:hypothetical protein
VSAIWLRPAGSTQIAAQPVGASVAATRERSTPAALDAGRATSASGSRPTAPANDARARSRAAATAWFAPFPPGSARYASPSTVRPGAGSSGTGEDKVRVDGAEDEDRHGRAPHRTAGPDTAKHGAGATAPVDRRFGPLRIRRHARNRSRAEPSPRPAVTCGMATHDPLAPGQTKRDFTRTMLLAWPEARAALDRRTFTVGSAPPVRLKRVDPRAGFAAAARPLPTPW